MSTAPGFDEIPLGRIIKWPGGFAMTLGNDWRGNPVRCCDGHDTPEAAKDHGLIRAIEIVQATGDHFLAMWAVDLTTPSEATS